MVYPGGHEDPVNVRITPALKHLMVFATGRGVDLTVAFAVGVGAEGEEFNLGTEIVVDSEEDSRPSLKEFIRSATLLPNKSGLTLILKYALPFEIELAVACLFDGNPSSVEVRRKFATVAVASKLLGISTAIRITFFDRSNVKFVGA